MAMGSKTVANSLIKPQKSKGARGVNLLRPMLVAGTGFEPVTFGL